MSNNVVDFQAFKAAKTAKGYCIGCREMRGFTVATVYKMPAGYEGVMGYCPTCSIEIYKFEKGVN